MKAKLFFKRFIAGIGIGIGAAIPGVSGAAIAVIFKVYEDIISAVNNFRKKFGYSIKVLIPILIGIICAVIPYIYLFSLAFEYLMFVLICIFAGFLIGSFPGITDEVKGVKPNKLQAIIIVIAALFVIALGLTSIFMGDSINIAGIFQNINSNWWLYLLLIPVGMVAAIALTVPGLSGSLILLILGFYRPLVDSAKTWGAMALKGDFSMFGQLCGVIGCFGVGCISGVWLVSKLMSKLLEKHHHSTFFAIIGFILGSIVVLFLNYDIFNYYKCWAGATLPSEVVINPVLHIYIEIPVGLVVLVGCAFASYMLVKQQRKNQVQTTDK